MAAKTKSGPSIKKSKQVAIRMPLPLLKRLDAFTNLLQQQSMGLRISRADAIRVALENWLTKVETEVKLNKGARKE